MLKRIFVVINFLITIVIVSSCSKDNTDFVEMNGRFNQENTDCEGFDCTEYIQFIGNSQADLGIGDIIYRVDYKISGEKIDLFFDKDRKMNFSFIVKNERTLLRAEDNTSWVKL
ncbi:MAG: hypothetical protein R3209_10775 [Salinimicrobium sediminis]|nr:hypothetical protein [Salinimicrobium sediminis]